MAKIAAESRELFNAKSKPFRDLVQKSLDKEKSILNLMKSDNSGIAYKKLLLTEEMIYITTLYLTINNLSVEILGPKNTDALNEGRKTLYKAIIYLEEIVTNLIDAPFSEYENNLKEIQNIPLSKRYLVVRKLGLTIDLILEGFGDNTKWKWSFTELQGRYATVTKNFLDLKVAMQDHFNPRSADYDTTVMYVRLIKRLLNESADGYRERYELSTRRIDDMRLAIQYLLALRRIHLLLNEKDEAEDIKKKAIVWKEKMEADQKKGTSK
ncbi:MAG TPA: hypothetical protein PK505_04365 [Treponemataceae bacterium]|nr:hypothetical protein [Treponemataceae bacterium]